MQTPPEEYDLVVLGSGEAGKYIAWTQARKGKRAVVIERKYIGGSCPNIACLPSKNVIHSAKVADLTRHAAEFGVLTDNVRVEMARAMAEGLNVLFDAVPATSRVHAAQSRL